MRSRLRCIGGTKHGQLVDTAAEDGRFVECLLPPDPPRFYRASDYMPLADFRVKTERYEVKTLRLGACTVRVLVAMALSDAAIVRALADFIEDVAR